MESQVRLSEIRDFHVSGLFPLHRCALWPRIAGGHGRRRAVLGRRHRHGRALCGDGSHQSATRAFRRKALHPWRLRREERRGRAKPDPEMWQNLILYAEHTFTSWGGYSRPNSEETQRQQFTKDQFVVNARQEINSIVDQAMSQLADRIHIPAPAIVVFNPLSWTRSGLVETDL